jgi:putative two-component system response regulator
MIVSRKGDLDAEVTAMEAGADAFFTAPVRSDVLDARVKACLRRKSGGDSLELSDPLLFALARSVEERDSSLGRHCERLALMAAVMGLRLGLSAEDIRTLQRGGYVHDIGKIALPDAVLLKPSPLDEHEWEIMKTHPVRGEAICSRASSLQAVLPLIRHHHERWDGSGYPDGLKGEQIPLLARILQMADIYDALTAERPYKPALSPEQALEIIREETRREWRDPSLLPVLEASLPLFSSDSFWDLAPLSLTSLNASLNS